MKKKIISVNAKVVRSVNRSMILNIIREQQPISRIELSRMTGLNKSTVSSIVTDLLNEDLIYERVNPDNNIGRNPINLFLKLGKNYIGAIFIDSTITRFAITELDGTIVAESSVESQIENPEECIKSCVNRILKLSKLNNIDKLYGLGITISGIVDSKNMIVKYASNLGWKNVEIGRILKDLCSDIEHIAVENDAKSSALAELWFGKKKGELSNFVFLTIGAGIGTGIVINRQLLYGEFSASGEFGHMSIFDKGDDCICGNKGCWESYASDKAVVSRYLKKVNKRLEKNVDFEVQDIIDLANQGNKIAKDIIEETGYYIGLGIVNIIKAIDPKTIIIGGRIITAWDIIYPEIIKVVKENSFFFGDKQIEILPTSLSVRPRLLGAATIAIKSIFDGYRITV